MEGMSRPISSRNTSKTIEKPKGIFRTTMSYNEQIMLCHFILKKGTAIPLHNHKAAQNGYVISGKLKFMRKDGDSFIAEAGTSYVFGSEEYHGAEVLEDSEVIECFSPMRPEYADS